MADDAPDISKFAHHAPIAPAQPSSAPDMTVGAPTPAKTAGIRAPLPGKPGTLKKRTRTL